ncbi:carph-isopro domain-containing protein [Paramagnetospirillum caucaseum]|uniref:carph-isopro domain-containing protein n=1 Tax=Paramagnetospirillum caucaseum TaxID=1244869 RepID=UPI00137663F2|nr:hypothetical protein [Paramagnetospirillum caucaseum]
MRTRKVGSTSIPGLDPQMAESVSWRIHATHRIGSGNTNHIDLARYASYRIAMKTFADIIALWGTATALAADIGETGLNVRAWRNRNSIPASRWLDVVAAAERRGFEGVTLSLFAHLAARPAPDSSLPGAVNSPDGCRHGAAGASSSEGVP